MESPATQRRAELAHERAVHQTTSRVGDDLAPANGRAVRPDLTLLLGLLIIFLMIGSEQHFRDSFGSDRADVLLRALTSGVARARHVAVQEGFVESRTEPTVAFDLATRNLDGRFDMEPGVHKAIVNAQILWIVDGTYAIRVKKLRTGYKPSNHDSGQQLAMTAQLRLDGMPELVFLTAGTRYSDLTGLADEFVIVKHYPNYKGKHIVEWVIDLHDLAAGGSGSASAPILPLTPAAPSVPAAAVVSKRRPAADTGTRGEK